MTPSDDASQILQAPHATLARTMAAVQEIEAFRNDLKTGSTGLSSNVSVDLLGLFLRKHALLSGVRMAVHVGDHDDHISNTSRFADLGLDNMVFLPMFDNLLPSFELQIPLLAEDLVRAKQQEFRSLCRLVFDKGSSLKRIFACSLHRRTTGADTGAPDAVDEALSWFNAALREEAQSFPNVRLIDTQAIIQTLGLQASIDERFYLRNTAPYTAVFLSELARCMALASRGFGNHFYKVLALDCDNTLWGGIVGEDQLEGIALDPHGHPGRVFWQAQLAYKRLETQGVLLCLCSKNNPDDVQEVFAKHPNAVLKADDVAASKVNWQDKVSNLKALAAELNLGLDSFVFVDDSDFECQAVRQSLPMVKVVQVPKNLSEYPATVRRITELFLGGGIAAESTSKTEQYRQRSNALAATAQFSTHEEYLASLDLRIQVRRNERPSLLRISELTMKSNQFNLTTLRLAPAEVQTWMQREDSAIYSITVSDRFGNAGLTGVVAVRWLGTLLAIDAFLMSCRVIGRGVEFALWQVVLADASARGCGRIQATFIPTEKNAQVSSFFETLGLTPAVQPDGIKRYEGPLTDLLPPATPWIKVDTE